MNDDTLYLGHILDSISAIQKYTARGRNEFMENQMIQDAVIRNLEIIGEATKNMSGELKQKHGSVNWRDIAGLRDKVIHDYAGVRVDLIWDVVENSLPQLQNQITKMLDEYSHRNDNN